MAFPVAIADILQYAYNMFGSMVPVLYLFVGATFGATVLRKLLSIFS